MIMNHTFLNVKLIPNLGCVISLLYNLFMNILVLKVFLITACSFLEEKPEDKGDKQAETPTTAMTLQEKVALSRQYKQEQEKSR